MIFVICVCVYDDIFVFDLFHLFFCHFIESPIINGRRLAMSVESIRSQRMRITENMFADNHKIAQHILVFVVSESPVEFPIDFIFALADGRINDNTK